MLKYQELSKTEQELYGTAARLTATYYLYPLIMQDLKGTEKLQQKYQRIISKAELGVKTPYGLKATLEQFEEILSAQAGEPTQGIEELDWLLLTGYSSSHCWLKPSIWEVSIYLETLIARYLLNHHSEEDINKLVDTFKTIHEWFYQGFTETDSKTDYLLLADIPPAIGDGYPVFLVSNPDPAIWQDLPSNAHTISRINGRKL